MASKRMVNCSVCAEAKPKLTMIDGNLYCSQCKEEMMEEDIKSEPQSEDGMDIEDENGYTQQTDNLGEHVGNDEFTADIKEETEFDEEADISKDTGLLMEKYTEDLQAEIDIKEEITIEETQVNIRDEDDVAPKNAGEKLRCSYCDLLFKSHRAYRVHIKDSHQEDMMVTCGICKFTCKGEKLYKAHIQEEHDGFECMCEICEELYHSGQSKSHKQRCKGRLLFQCKSCKNYYGKKESVWKHLDEHDILKNAKESSFIKLCIKEPVYVCEICEDNKVFRQSLYRKHIESEHRGHHLCCERCLKTFRTPASRSSHICTDGKTDSTCEKVNSTVDHGPESSKTPQAKEFKCSECPKIYPHAFLLNEHLQKEHQLESISCEICGMEFRLRHRYIYHKKTAHVEPKYSCSHCQKKFHFRSHYVKHICMQQTDKNQVQNGSAVGSADQPGKAESKQTLRCYTYCGLHFATNPDYRNHLKESHPEDRKAVCSICFFSCQGDTLYREHIREKHGGFECMCKICLELYHLGTYEDHKMQCQGRLVFLCNSCEECYGKKESLWKHLDGHAIPEDSKEQSTTECRIKELFYSCRVCEDDKLYERAIYWKHIENAHDGHPVRCSKCLQMFKTSRSLNKHTCTDATDDKANTQGNSVPELKKWQGVLKELKCPECPKAYFQRFRLNEHIKLRHGIVPVPSKGN